MFVEVASGCIFIAATGVYQFWQQWGSLEPEPEPQPVASVDYYDIQYFQEALTAWISTLDVADLLTNWISIGFYVVSAAVAIWAGILQPFKWRRRHDNEIMLTDLMPQDVLCDESMSEGANQENYSSGKECSDEFPDDFQMTEYPGVPNQCFHDSVHGFGQQHELHYDENAGCSTVAGMESDLELAARSYLADSISEKPPASFLSEISDKDKARVEKILNANTDICAQNSTTDDDSNFCTTSLSSRVHPCSPSALRGLEPPPAVQQNRVPTTIHPKVQGASFGDVQKAKTEERSSISRSFSKSSLGGKQNDLGVNLGSARSGKSSQGVEKPPSGNLLTPNVKQSQSKIPVKRSSSMKRNRSHCSVSSKTDSECKGHESRSRSSRKQEHVVGSRASTKQSSASTKKEHSFSSANMGCRYTCSDESEVSVQSLLDQSEFSLLTSSPEAKLPDEYTEYRNRSRISKSLAGKSIDDKFNSLLDVVIRNCDDINALFRATSQERQRSTSQNRAKRTTPARNRAKSCPRVQRNLLGSQGSNVSGQPNNVNVDKQSSSSCRSYANGNYFAMGATYNVSNFAKNLNPKSLNSRLKNPPMRFGNEDKTVFIAAGHYRPSDIEIMKQKGNLRHVEMNLLK